MSSPESSFESDAGSTTGYGAYARSGAGSGRPHNALTEEEPWQVRRIPRPRS